jgi:hypothetical protein
MTGSPKIAEGLSKKRDIKGIAFKAKKMESILLEKLRSYITINNPDMMILLQQDLSVTGYLEDKVQLVLPLSEQLIAEGKPLYIIEELCLETMTKDLRPSKFHYIKEILETEFLQSYEKFREAGVLTYEVINMIEVSRRVFELTGFNEENENDRQLRYAVIGSISEYLDRN